MITKLVVLAIGVISSISKEGTRISLLFSLIYSNRRLELINKLGEI
jgi:hypothetical protein